MRSLSVPIKEMYATEQDLLSDLNGVPIDPSLDAFHTALREKFDKMTSKLTVTEYKEVGSIIDSDGVEYLPEDRRNRPTIEELKTL